jgi:hypothetical protein
MYDLIRETFFGQIVHLASRGKLFLAAEQRDPSKILRYTKIKSTLNSRTAEHATQDALESDKVDPEIGPNFQLVEWDENDPEV